MWRALMLEKANQLVMIHDGGLSWYSDPMTKKERTVTSLKEVSAGAMVANKAQTQLFVGHGDTGTIGVYDVATHKLLRELDLAGDGKKLGYANDLVLSKDEKFLYVVDVANQDLLTFDLTANKLVSRVKAGREPYAIALSSDGKRLFVANIGLFDYSVIPKPRDGFGDPNGLELPPFAFPSKEAENGVEREGRFVPGLGSPYVPDAQSIFAYSLATPSTPVKTKDVKAGLLIHAPADGGKAVGGSQPNALLTAPGRLYVSCANNDLIQVFDDKTLKLVKQTKIVPQPLVGYLRGVIPTGLGLSGDGSQLYVCESGINAVGVFDAKSLSVKGHIPSGWFPTSVQANQGKLYVATQKGLGRGPRGFKTPPKAKGDERLGYTDLPGMTQIVAAPSTKELTEYTAEVLSNNGMIPAKPRRDEHPISQFPGKPSEQIKYVVFITKENHTFDGIFGGLRGANGEPEYAQFGLNGWTHEKGKSERHAIMPNHIRLAEQFAISDNFYMEPEASGDGHRWLVGVYPSIWTTKVFYSGWNFALSDQAKGRLVSFGSNGSQIPEDYLENGSLWEHLDRGKIRFRNYGEGFELAAQDEPDNPPRSGSLFTVNHPMSKVLWDNTCWDYPVYNNDIPDIARVQWFKEDIEKNFRAKGKPLPQFMNATICNDHGSGAKPAQGYPFVSSFMADNDLALGQMVDYLSHQPEWKNMAIFVTQDDSGGDNDHVDRDRSFVLCISPWVKRGYVGHDHTSIMSILKTIYGIYGLGPNNMFDGLATDLGEMFTMTPDYTPYTFVPTDPAIFDPKVAFDPNDPKIKARRWMKPSMRMDDPKFVDSLRHMGPKGSRDEDDD